MPAAEPDRGLSPDAVDLPGVRAMALSRLAFGALVTSWAWIVWVGRTLEQSLVLTPIYAPAILFVAAGAILLLPRLPALPRSSLLLGGAFLCFALQYALTGDDTWLYCQVLVVLLSVPLAAPPAPLLLAAIVSLLLLGLTWLVPAGSHGLPPVLAVVWSAAGVSWVGANALYTILGWAIDSQADAWRTATEVIKRRAQLRRTLDSLHNAHTALERTTRELEAARLEAEEARQVKGRFVANISHELRTPLNVIVGFAEILCTSPESYGDFVWPPALREDLYTVWQNARHLLSMVDDVLDLAQIEASHLPIMPEPTDLNQLIRDALVNIGPLLRGADVELRVSLSPGLPLLSLDRTRIRQVLLNLANNAVRFTSSGYIEVGTMLRDDAVVTYVRDTGAGIPKDKLERIFDEFEQVDTSIRRPHQGAGLGLAISRQFLALHSGRVWAESTEGSGSTFFFALPLPGQTMAVQPRLPRRPMPATACGDEAEARVVVLSSDQMAVRVLERHLADVRIEPVASEPEAVAAVCHQHPDAVFIIADPGAVAEAVAQAERIVEAVAPLDLAVAVSTMPTERGASSLLGVPELLIKPVAAADLLTPVRRLCPNPGKVLIVDDDPDTVRLYSRLLRQAWGHLDIMAADTARGAVTLLAQQPDLILLDLQLPDATGVTVLEAARAGESTAKTPVIVVTARGPAQELLPDSRGAVHVLRSSPFSATETVRFLGMLTRALPARYAGAHPEGSPPGLAPGIRGAVPA